ncbi:MAG: glycosyltransferase family 4 protein [Clostridium sp.]|jgi:spore coat protein SA|uniref:glycosyltransferase family 4 protein n=1 Tax=Clostridium TaxID=1485 RepID=UPI000C07411C|nr:MULTISPECIES: glycosyltransferase family 4 protein [Clostridium]MDU2460594.1 glycosyltransferase family 4 protein [Clostridium sp.]MDU2681950.1 glycosyltransferase family 4 protein [Clostridium sp.]
MNIIIISTGILPQPAVKGGAVETLVDILINYNEENLNNTIQTYSIYDEEAIKYSEKYDKCNFIYIKINKLIRYLFNKGIMPIRFMSKFFINKVSKHIKDLNDFDLIVLQNQFNYLYKIEKVSNNKPLILHLHNDYINKYNKKFEKKIKPIDSIITVSDFLKTRIMEASDSISVTTVHNGISIDKFKKTSEVERSKLRKKYSINENDIVVIFAGRLSEEKGIKELLLAFNELPINMSIKLLIIGSSFFNDSRESKFIKELKTIANVNKDKIIFTGFIPYDEIGKYYSIADIGCVPSTCNEAFGLTVIEQMSIGLPMIVSNMGALPEIVSEGSSIIVEYDENYIHNIRNALEILYNDGNLRTRMANNAIRRSRLFSHNIYAKKYFEAINKLIKKE